MEAFPRSKSYTGWIEWMSHRKGRETKQQPSMLTGPAVPGGCLVSFRFLCNTHSIQSVGILKHEQNENAVHVQISMTL